MTTKEKAQELFTKYYDEICNLIDVNNGKEKGERYKVIMPISKKCALIAVDEMLDFRNNLYFNEGSLAHKYLLDVKQEINNL